MPGERAGNQPHGGSCPDQQSYLGGIDAVIAQIRRQKRREHAERGIERRIQDDELGESGKARQPDCSGLRAAAPELAAVGSLPVAYSMFGITATIRRTLGSTMTSRSPAKK